VLSGAPALIVEEGGGGVIVGGTGEKVENALESKDKLLLFIVVVEGALEKVDIDLVDCDTLIEEEKEAKEVEKIDEGEEE